MSRAHRFGRDWFCTSSIQVGCIACISLHRTASATYRLRCTRRVRCRAALEQMNSDDRLVFPQVSLGFRHSALSTSVSARHRILRLEPNQLLSNRQEVSRTFSPTAIGSQCSSNRKPVPILSNNQCGLVLFQARNWPSITSPRSSRRLINIF